MPKKSYLDYLINPLELLRTKRVLQVNPTVIPDRKEQQDSLFFLFEYDVNTCDFYSLSNSADCYQHLNTPQTSWINIDGINKNVVDDIARHFSIHQLIVDDILSINQRPKTDEINGLLFCVLNMLYFNEKDACVETEQVSIILGKDFVISFQDDATRDVFNNLREKIKVSGSKIRQNKADFLFYALIDSVVDHYFLVMEKLGDKIEEMEEEVIKPYNSRTLVKINSLRKEMILLKRSIGPVRDLINGILKSESELIEEKNLKYFRDVHNHIIQANDLAENYRDMLVNIHDLYMSNVNLRLNESMKIMAVVTCLLAPATVIGGIFGMNFDFIPLQHQKLGFVISLIAMVILPLLMFRYFKRKKWF